MFETTLEKWFCVNVGSGFGRRARETQANWPGIDVCVRLRSTQDPLNTISAIQPRLLYNPNGQLLPSLLPLVSTLGRRPLTSVFSHFLRAPRREVCMRRSPVAVYRRRLPITTAAATADVERCRDGRGVRSLRGWSSSRPRRDSRGDRARGCRVHIVRVLRFRPHRDNRCGRCVVCDRVSITQ